MSVDPIDTTHLRELAAEAKRLSEMQEPESEFRAAHWRIRQRELAEQAAAALPSLLDTIATLTARVAEVDGECRRSMATIAELRAIADLERRAAENARLREALAPFAGAADELAAEYGVLMRPETGCSIKFSALAAARAALTDAEAAEWPSDGTCVRCGAAPRGADGLCATCHDEDSAALTATPAPSVERPYLTTYEVQVLLGCSIHGCGMRPDRTFKLPEAWRSLHALGLIDRTDGLAIVTDKGERVIAAIRAALSPPQQAGRETGERS